MRIRDFFNSFIEVSVPVGIVVLLLFGGLAPLVKIVIAQGAGISENELLTNSVVLGCGVIAGAIRLSGQNK